MQHNNHGFPGPYLATGASADTFVMQARLVGLVQQLAHQQRVLEEQLSNERLYRETHQQQQQRQQADKGQTRYWGVDEHERFLEAAARYGFQDYKAIAVRVGTRSVAQVRTHSQKYVLKLKRDGVDATTVPEDERDRSFERRKRKVSPLTEQDEQSDVSGGAEKAARPRSESFNSGATRTTAGGGSNTTTPCQSPLTDSTAATAATTAAIMTTSSGGLSFPCSSLPPSVLPPHVLQAQLFPGTGSAAAAAPTARFGAGGVASSPSFPRNMFGSLPLQNHSGLFATASSAGDGGLAAFNNNNNNVNNINIMMAQQQQQQLQQRLQQQLMWQLPATATTGAHAMMATNPHISSSWMMMPGGSNNNNNNNNNMLHENAAAAASMYIQEMSSNNLLQQRWQQQ